MQHPFDMPATAVCPGCETTVVLPPASGGEIPPTTCTACGLEVPDPRRDYSPPAPANPQGYILAPPEPQAAESDEGQRYSRRNLFRSLGGVVAEKGIERIEDAKLRFSDEP